MTGNGQPFDDGKLDAWQEHFITFTADGKKPASGADYSGFLITSCKAPNLRRGVTMMGLKIPTGPWRAPGDNAQVFVQQSFMHELSLASGRDHVQFLLDAVNRDVPELAPKSPKVNFSPARASAVIKLCAEKASWGRKLHKGSGLGLAWCYSHAGHVAQPPGPPDEGDCGRRYHACQIQAGDAASRGDQAHEHGHAGELESMSSAVEWAAVADPVPDEKTPRHGL